MSVNLDLGDTRAIIAYAKDRGVLRNQLAYILATAFIESAHTILPVKETVMAWHKNKFPSDAEVIRRLDNAMAKGNLPQVSKPYWRAGWFGRGHNQVTHDYNYRKAEKETGIQFTKNPDLMLISENSIICLVRGMMEGWWTGKKVPDYITLKRSGFMNARRVVNGMDRAADFAAKAREYDAALKIEGYGETTSPPIVRPALPPKPKPATIPAPAKRKSWADFFAAMFERK